MFKDMDTIGNRQTLVCTVGVSQHMHKILNMWKFELDRLSKLRDINERKKYSCRTMVTRSYVLSDALFRVEIKFIGNNFFLENYVTLAVSHNVLYYQLLPITRNQERFYDNNLF